MGRLVQGESTRVALYNSDERDRFASRLKTHRARGSDGATRRTIRIQYVDQTLTYEPRICRRV